MGATKNAGMLSSSAPAFFYWDSAFQRIRNTLSTTTANVATTTPTNTPRQKVTRANFAPSVLIESTRHGSRQFLQLIFLPANSALTM
jgi:hypothetical protein